MRVIPLRIERMSDIVGAAETVAPSALSARTALDDDVGASHRREVLLKSSEAFDRELPRMLADHLGEWVAFSGSTRLGFADTRTALIRVCMSQGLHPGEFLVRRVEPQAEDVVETPRLVTWHAEYP